MSSVALVGSGASTMYAANDSKADEVWSLSWMYNQELYPGVLPRMDRMFELHQLWLFQNTNNKKLDAHWNWLQEEHQFPIYIQEDNPLIPSGVEFPFDEINDDLFGGRLISIMPDGTEDEDIYYSSSISFMIALAIFEKFERIEVYGLEMITDTEYRYQVPGANFMTGLAVGRGIEFVRPDNSTFARSTLYAYEVTQMISGPQLDAGLKSFQGQLDEEMDKLKEISSKYQTMYNLAQSGKANNKTLKRLANERMEAEKRVERCSGAVQSIDWQINTIAIEGLITRSQLDFGLGSYEIQREKEIAKMNLVKGKGQALHIISRKDERQSATASRFAQEAMEAEKRVERCIGALQSVQWQIDVIDLKDVEPLVEFDSQLQEVKH